MTYNVLNYSGDNSEDDAREEKMRSVIRYVNPDILVAEEVFGPTGYNHLLEDILNYESIGLYEGAPFLNQTTTDADIALFYKPDVFKYIGSKIIDLTSSWGHRDAVEITMKHITSRQEFRLFGVHFKAGSQPENEEERESEASRLRDYLNSVAPDSHFLVLGDFNLYHSGEGGFLRLTETQDNNGGQLFDPINRIGYWHNNSKYADVHTQSSRANYGGENYGGMDDRFDFILVSAAILSSTSIDILEDSYTALGNDGDHFNQAINEGNNSAVPDDIADALMEASDHVPVFVKLQFKGRNKSIYRVVINEIMKNPEMVSDSYGEWFEIYNADTMSIDLRGWTIHDNDSDTHVITSTNPVVIEPGGFLVLAQNGNSALNGGVDVHYDYSGFQLSNTEDEIILLDESGSEVDRVEYDNGIEFPNPRGASMALLATDADNNIGSNWTVSTTPYGDGNNLGTPGEINYDISTTEEFVYPDRFELFQNYPNPFNSETTISFSLPHGDQVELTIFNIQGREVARLVNTFLEKGTYKLLWHADGLPSGVYFYRLRNKELSLTRKLILLN